MIFINKNETSQISGMEKLKKIELRKLANMLDDSGKGISLLTCTNQCPIALLAACARFAAEVFCRTAIARRAIRYWLV
jgi:hypothetical protein